MVSASRGDHTRMTYLVSMMVGAMTALTVGRMSWNVGNRCETAQFQVYKEPCPMPRDDETREHGVQGVNCKVEKHTFAKRMEEGGKLIFTHIPKCAGTSFVSELKGKHHLYLKNEIAWKMEQCFLDLQESKGIHLIFLRSPRKHLLSQFMECKYTEWGHTKTKNTDFPQQGELYDDFQTWIDHFHNLNEDKKTWGKEFAYNCYNPRNMQSRYLTCQAPGGPNPEWQYTKAVYPHFAHEKEPSLTEAILNLDKHEWIGVADLYHESLCVFVYRHKGTLPSNCKCPFPQNAGHTHNTHSVPEHHVGTVPSDTLRKVDELSLLDQGLFIHGLALLLADIYEVQKETRTRFLCAGRLEGVYDQLSFQKDAAAKLKAAYKDILQNHPGSLKPSQELQIQMFLMTSVPAAS
uniref:Sulfotransferase n=1 Tax=Picocystis salinarum TaxID=88271 RepID=A0A7S3UFS8_9CHLO|mmetsp:Transcript_5047/g.32121  ORF Transcript_5047/g.32121 Transcript_5047/m.32121 type:complete len:405 (+) Transcript_5047:53-1267(+)